jgi:hypothetical protein
VRRGSCAVFGLLLGCQALYGVPVDDGVDDAAVSTVTLTVPSLVVTSESVPVTASITGTPHTKVICTFGPSGSAGGFGNADIVVDLDAMGRGVGSAMYTAPGSAGSYSVSATVGAVGSAALVSVLQTLGNDAMLASATVAPAMHVVGTELVLTSGATVVALGAWLSNVPTAGTTGQLGLYASGATLPTSLLAATDVVTVANGRNVFALAPTPAAAGTYWVLGVYDHSVGASSLSVGDQLYSAASAASAGSNLPDTAPAGTIGSGELAYFMGAGSGSG